METTIAGDYCPIDLPSRCWDPSDEFVRVLNDEHGNSTWGFDDEGFQTGQRINGFDQCPRCGLWWPCIEEPDCWEETARHAGCQHDLIEGHFGFYDCPAHGVIPCTEVTVRHLAVGWWGGTFCEECELLLITQPDGTPEAYQL